MGADLFDRRSIIKGAGLGSGAALAAATLLPPAAQAQSGPEIVWQLQSDFQRSVGPLFGGAENLAVTVAGLTDGRFRIELTPSTGDRSRPPGTLARVESGEIQACHTSASYYVSRNPAFAFGSSLPFGLNARMQNAWTLEAGGQHLFESFCEPYNLIPFLAGNTGAQMGGWFRKEIRSVTELAGMKMRIAGLGGTVLARLGVNTVDLPISAVAEALRNGAVDAAEFSGPAADEPFAFYKVAPYYYYPGWWDGGAPIQLFVNKSAFQALPSSYQMALRTAAAFVNNAMLARMDMANNQAIRRLVAQGALLRPFPTDVLEAAYKASFALYDELSASHPEFKAIYEPWKTFRDEIYQWYRVAEYGFDSFGFEQQAKGL